MLLACAPAGCCPITRHSSQTPAAMQDRMVFLSMNTHGAGCCRRRRLHQLRREPATATRDGDAVRRQRRCTAPNNDGTEVRQLARRRVFRVERCGAAPSGVPDQDKCMATIRRMTRRSMNGTPRRMYHQIVRERAVLAAEPFNLPRPAPSEWVLSYMSHPGSAGEQPKGQRHTRQSRHATHWACTAAGCYSPYHV